MSSVDTSRWSYASSIFVAVLLAVTLGCHALSPNSIIVPYDTQTPASSESALKARDLNVRGVKAFNTENLPKAEEFFRKSLDADQGYGPAHNNLGQIYLARHQLYLAAWEFEYAANLMPDLVEPILGQGLAYETGEKLERALEFYRRAYERKPNHPVAIASLARTMVKLDADPMEIAFLLDELIMNDSRQVWIEWAKELRATRYRHIDTGCPPTFPASESSESAGMIESSIPLNGPIEHNWNNHGGLQELRVEEFDHRTQDWQDPSDKDPAKNGGASPPKQPERSLLLPVPVETDPLMLPEYSDQSANRSKRPTRLGMSAKHTAATSKSDSNSFQQWRRATQLSEKSRVEQASFEVELNPPQSFTPKDKR